MKQKDFALIAVIVFISAIVSFFISGLLFGGAKNRDQQAEAVHPVTSSFQQPDKRYFNKDAFNPTKQITIGQNTNPDPFSSKSSQ